MFICRRLQDIIERSQGEPLTLIFLDWEKAFDKVDQEELLNAIKRMNVPDKINRVLKTWLKSVTLDEKISSGIARGPD